MSLHEPTRSGRNASLLRQIEKQLDIFGRFVETSGQAWGMADLEGRVFYANDTSCGMLGEASPEDVYRHELFDYYSPETVKRLKEEILPLVRQDGQWVGELNLIGKGGSATPTIENIFLLRDDKGEPLAFATVFTDISERIRIEKELHTYRDHLEQLVGERTAELEKSNVLMQAQIAERRQAEEEHTRLLKILDSTSDLVGAALPDGSGFYMNAAGRLMAGFGIEEDLSQHNMSEVHPAWAWPYVEEGIKTAIKQGVWEGETVIVNHRDGKEIPVSQVIMAHRTTGGEIDFISTIIRDIGERKRVEEALRESEEKFRTIVDNMQDAFYRCDPNGELVYTTPSAARLLGCSSAEEMIGMKVIDFYYYPEQAEKHYETLNEHGTLTQYEVTLKRRDTGEPVIVLANSQFYRDRDGNIVGVEGVYSDITERKRIEGELHKLASVVRHSNELVNLAYLDGKMFYLNEAGMKMLGISADEVASIHITQVISDRLLDKVRKEVLPAMLAGGWDGELEYKNLQSGALTAVYANIFLVTDVQTGTPLYFANLSLDITERKRAEDALRQSEEKYRLIVDMANEGMWLLDADLITSFVNARSAEMIGYKMEEIIGRRFENFLFEEDLADHAQRMEARKRGVSDRYERRLRHKDGHVVIVLLSATSNVDNDGRFQGAFAMLTDITERKQAEEALKKSEERFRGLAESMTELVWIADGEGRSIYHNPQYAEYTGLQQATLEERLAIVHPEDRTQVHTGLRDAIDSGKRSLQQEIRLRRRDGVYRWFLTRVILMRDADTRVNRLFGTATDIDDLIQTKQALQDNLEILALSEHIGHIGSWKMDVSTNIFTVSDEMRRMMAYPEDEEITFEALQSYVHPDDLRGVVEKWRKTLEEGTPCELEFRGIHPDGTIHYVESRAEASSDPQGRPEIVHGYAVDVTERKRLEDELIKAQKLDSIGRLAGGLAHDYNNLLTSILGNVDLAKMHVSKTDKVYTHLMEAEKATMRARDLTRQLITFSQGGTPFSAVMPIHDLLIQSVGLSLSGSDTKAQWKIADDLPDVKVDENQIHQVIHNIVINAQEAMPNGGILSIVADKAVLGPDNPLSLGEGMYVRLAFSDEGCGIPPENLPKIFDPYFTTKDRGTVKGMGLGLSICYSIMKRHGGNIMVDSLLGKGTTVTLYIPAAVAPAAG